MQTQAGGWSETTSKNLRYLGSVAIIPI